jgi:hypothetical protein
MTTKLTLTVDKAVIERAKVYAKQTGRSLSELVENHLLAVTETHFKSDLSPRLKKIVGVVKLPADFDEERERRAAMESKHL